MTPHAISTLGHRPPRIALISGRIDMRYLLSPLQKLYPGIECRLIDDLGDRSEIDAAICWQAPAGVLKTLPNLKLIQSLGAGVDHVFADPELPSGVPVCRISEPGMTGGMNAYVAWAVINRHRHFPEYVQHSAQGQWRECPIVAPADHPVGIAGMGRLGQAAARVLTAIGYPVHGWSRTAKADLPEGVTGHAGTQGLQPFLASIDTLVCLLPLTEETQGFLGAATFSQMRRGSHLVNVGRGGHLVEADLLAALDSGQLASATLDTTQVEPLPQGHAFWGDPRILVTPHIATRTPPATIARQTLDNLLRLQTGAPLHARAFPEQGY